MPGKRVPGHEAQGSACACGWDSGKSTKRARRAAYAEHLAGVRSERAMLCRDCHLERTPREMSKSKPSICKKCSTARTRAWAAANPDDWERTRRRSYLKRKYGITPEEYDSRLDQQGGRCAICRRLPPDSRGFRMHIDHDHQTGKFRGVLCGPCNQGIGNLGDDPERLLAAVAYLHAASG